MKNKSQKNSGVALLLSLGILALMSILGVAFSTNMRLGERTSLDFIRNIQVRYVSEGGIQRGIAELKYHHASDYTSGNGAKYGFFDTRFVDPNQGEYWYYVEKYGSNDQNGNGIPFEYLAGVPLEDAPQVSATSRIYDWTGNFSDIPLGSNFTIRYDLKIIDTGSQINVNDTDNANLSTILQNLCSYLGSPLSSSDGTSISSGGPYNTKGDVKLALDSNGDGILSATEEAKYDLIKDFIAANSYADPNNSNKSPINLNTASWQVIASVLAPLLSSSNPEAAAKNIIGYGSTPVRYLSWASFRWGLENYTSLDEGERETVHNSVNPNRGSASTDTKFIFNSGGYYEIESLGTIRDQNNNIIAQKKISTLVQMFDMWNMTTKEQFRDNVNTEDNGDKKAQWVTWWDNCPIDLDASYNISYTYDSGNTIPNSLKLGFWDDFAESEDDSDNEYRLSVWKKFDEQVDGGGGTDISYISPGTEYTIGGGSLYAYDSNSPGWPLVTIGYDIDRGASGDENEKWYCDNFLLMAYITDASSSPSHYIPYDFLDEYYSTGAVTYRKYDAVTQVLVRAGAFDQNTTVFLSEKDPASDDVDEHKPPESPPHEDYYPEYSNIRIIRGSNSTTSSDLASDSYTSAKIFRVEGYLNRTTEDGPDINNVKTTIYNNSGSTIGELSLDTPLTPGPSSHWGVGAIGFYGATMPFYLDNVRVIPDEGQYESKYIRTGGVSPAIDEFPSSYEWGTIFATTTLSPGANYMDEIVQLDSKSDTTGDDWSNQLTGTNDGDYDNDGMFHPYFSGDGMWRQINEADSSDIQFLAVLKSDHSDDLNFSTGSEYDKIPVLEDIWITYLPKTKILYWREK